jgi:hypothetical protein
MGQHRIHVLYKSIFSTCRAADDAIVRFFRSHAYLCIAILSLAIFIWGCVTRHTGFAIGSILLGGLSYFFGLSVAVLFGIVFTFMGVVHSGVSSQAATAAVELLGYICVAWLGYGHRVQNVEQKQLEKERSARENGEGDTHRDQIVPWSVVNEVRTSLAAVRFLLFPLHDKETGTQLEKATNELSRLEKIFSEIERDNQPREGVSSHDNVSAFSERGKSRHPGNP